MCVKPVRQWIQWSDGTKRPLEVPCGHCLECKQAKAREWTARIEDEMSLYEDNLFITLTYSDENLPAKGSLEVKALQDFWKRLRKALYPKKFRYFSCGEYGETYGRPHYHAIVFGLSLKEAGVIESCWPYGFVRVCFARSGCASYVAGYVTKKLYGPDKEYYVKRGLLPPFTKMSLKPGIGFGYLLKTGKWLYQKGYDVRKGYKQAIPRFYKQKIYTADDMDDLKNRLSELQDDYVRSLNEKFRYRTPKILEYKEALSRNKLRSAEQKSSFKKKRDFKN